MRTDNPTTIASSNWGNLDEDLLFARDVQNSSIATEIHQEIKTDPKWESATDALIKAWQEARAGLRPEDDFEWPSLETIDAACQWLLKLKKQSPDAPPTLINNEPAGGLIIERRALMSDGSEIMEELTLSNQRCAEMTVYLDNKIINMYEVPFDIRST